jgi:hypothetical protein
MPRCLIDLQTTLSLNLDNCILIVPDEMSGNSPNLIAELGIQAGMISLEISENNPLPISRDSALK